MKIRAHILAICCTPLHNVQAPDEYRQYIDSNGDNMPYYYPTYDSGGFSGGGGGGGYVAPTAPAPSAPADSPASAPSAPSAPGTTAAPAPAPVPTPQTLGDLLSLVNSGTGDYKDGDGTLSVAGVGAAASSKGGMMVVIAVLAVAAFFGYRWYQKRNG